MVVTSLDSRMPATASHLRRRGDTEFRRLQADVLRNEADGIAEITTLGHAFFPALGQSTVLHRDRLPS